jgi:hypothetical protein
MGSRLLQRLASSPTRRGKNVCVVYLAAGSYTQAGGELAPQSLAHYLRVARRCRSVSGYPLAWARHSCNGWLHRLQGEEKMRARDTLSLNHSLNWLEIERHQKLYWCRNQHDMFNTSITCVLQLQIWFDWRSFGRICNCLFKRNDSNTHQHPKIGKSFINLIVTSTLAG